MLRAHTTALVALLTQDRIRLQGGGSEKECNCFYADHDDETPSMRVDVTKGVYFCQGCKRGGNAYTYLHDLRGLAPKECFEILEHQYGWDDTRLKTARTSRDTQAAERAESHELEPAKWTEEIYPQLGSPPQSLDQVHEFCRADRSLAYVTASYKPNADEKAIKGIPFVPATSKGGGYWVKSPIGSKALAIPAPDRPFAEDEPYPIYGLLPLLDRKEESDGKPPDVWVVDGEKCADAVNRLTWTDKKGKTQDGPPAVSVRHGYRTADRENPFPMLDLEPLRGRRCVVFADPDKTGHEVAEATARTLYLHYKCKVRILLPPVAEKDEPKVDIADMAAHEGIPAIRRWAKQHGIKDYEPAPHERPAPVIPASAMAETDEFRVLGIVADRLAIRRKTTQEVHLLRRSAITQEGMLLQIAPLRWWEERSRKHIRVFSSHMRSAFGNALLRAGEEKGQMDLSQDLVGRGAHEVEEKVRFNCGSRLLTADDDGLLTQAIPLDKSDFVYDAGPEIELHDDERAEQWAREFYEATSRYRWQSPDVHRSVMGWCVTSLIGGCLPFRPHLWIVAPSSTGKSYVLHTMLGRFFGPVVKHLAACTEASLAGVASSDSLPVTLDEFEVGRDSDSRAKWDHILELLRIATSDGGSRTRATQTGFVKTLRSRFSACVASIHRPELDKADDSRFVTVGLSPIPVPDWPSVDKAIREATRPEKMLAVRTRIIRHTARIHDEALELTRAMLADDSFMDTRHAETAGALTAGARFLSGEKEPIAIKLAGRDDPWTPLVSLMGQPIPRQGLGDIMVAEALHRAYFQNGRFLDPDPECEHKSASTNGPACLKALCRMHGFQFASASELWIAPKHPAMQRLMDGHEHNVANWPDYLADLPGCFRPRKEGTQENIRQYFGGKKLYVVALGPEALEAIGLGGSN